MRLITTPEQRSKHIEVWRSSGLSQAAYCRQNGLNITTFTNWLGYYKKQASLSSNLIPVRFDTPTPASSHPLVLRHARGYSLELPASQPAPWVAELSRCLD